jgi:NitT/TauT family transport system substrate-binding protein
MNSTTTRKGSRLLAVMVTISLLCSACIGGADDEELDKVTAAWLPIMQTTAYYVALEKGIFEKYGIEIESVKFESPNAIIDALVAGQADFGPPGAAAGIAMLAESKFPGTFHVFGLQGGGINVDRINDGLIVREDSDIESFADLKGKTIGTVPGIQWETITRHLVREAGLDPDTDVRVIGLGVALHVPSIVSGSVDATLSLEPVGSIADAADETKRAMENPVAQTIADPFYSGAALLTSDFIEERPDVARRVVLAIDEATRLVNENFEEYKKILPKYTSIEDTQLDFVAQPYLRPFNELNETDLNSYQAFVDVFESEGVLKEHIDVREKILDPALIGLDK